MEHILHQAGVISARRPCAADRVAQNTETTKLQIAKLRERRVAGVRPCSIVGTSALAVQVRDGKAATGSSASQGSCRQRADAPDYRPGGEGR